MRKIIVSEFVSLDGVMEDPGGAEHFKHGGWSFKFFSPEAGQYKLDELFSVDAMLLGRVTYDGFAAVWPTVRDEQGFADRMNSIPKYVVSTTLQNPKWHNSHVISGNIVEEIIKLKQQDGKNILVAGSCQLLQMLIANDLVDEYRLIVHPIILGCGKRMFGPLADSKTLKLTANQTLGSGVMVQVYEPLRY